MRLVIVLYPVGDIERCAFCSLMAAHMIPHCYLVIVTLSTSVVLCFLFSPLDYFPRNSSFITLIVDTG